MFWRGGASVQLKQEVNGKQVRNAAAWMPAQMQRQMKNLKHNASGLIYS